MFPAAAVVCRPFETEVDLTSASPPTARAQTPPPGWLGVGFGGAETNALPCWVKNTLSTLPIAPAIAELAAQDGVATSATPPTPFNEAGLDEVVTHWAKAEELESASAKAAPVISL